MLSIVCHLWPSRYSPVKNCYQHWYLLGIHNGNKTDSILHSGEGVTQGFSLVMVTHELGFLLLIKKLKAARHEIMQSWYSDEAGALGAFQYIEDSFNSLTQEVMDCTYFPEPKKAS